MLGKRFGAAFKDIKSKIEALDHQAIKTFLDAETLTINNETFGVDDILIFREAREGTDTVSDRFMSIELRTDLTEELIEEGLAREIVSRMQKLRKELGFNVTDRIHTDIAAAPSLIAAFAAHEQYVCKETLTTTLTISDELAQPDLSTDIDGAYLRLALRVIEAPSG